jgi:la-related protein 6
MSEVDGEKGVDTAGEEAGPMKKRVEYVENLPHGGPNMVAPTLRVEELKDDGHSSSGPYISEDEPGSHGEASDQDITKVEKPFVAPDDELRDRIITQVNFYFSDANILKDAFLLKHVRRNKQGYVSLKLITSFKKVKSMTKDYRVVAYSLRLSDDLEVNEEGTKVRRKQALPDYDETTPSRTVVGVNLPQENPTIEHIAEMFASCGDIALIRILRPGKTIPNDVKKHINKHPEIGTTVCAVVEFESHESARKACQTMTNKDDWRGGMRVVLLAMKKR